MALPIGQVALLRRQDSVLVAVATTVPPSGNAREAVLVFSRAPEVFDAGGRGWATGGILRVSAQTVAAQQLAGVEYPAGGAAGPPGGRLRFAIDPPPPLSAMRPGEVALSDPVLLVPEVGSNAVLADAARALGHMAAGDTVSRGNSVGLYWESYGFAPDDTVEITVALERFTRDGVFRRLGQALRLAEDRNTPVSVGWVEPQMRRDVHVTPGAVPIIGRHATLDLERLPPGEYWLVVSVGAPGREPATSRRVLTLRE